MSQCPESDVLLRIEEATECNALAQLAHIADCAQCRQVLDQLEVIASVRHGVQPDAEFDMRVAASLRALRAEFGAPSVRAASGVRAWRPVTSMPAVAVFALATVSAWLLLMVSTWWSAPGAASTPQGATAALSVASGAFAAWQALRLERRAMRSIQPH